jgi:hypothetical protein
VPKLIVPLSASSDAIQQMEVRGVDAHPRP